MAKGPTDTGKLTINLGSFVGGESIDFKNGVANAFLSSEPYGFPQQSLSNVCFTRLISG
jgi:hypothetical protein